MGKFTVSYTRTVKTLPYENLKIGLSEEYDDGEVPREYAFSQVRQKVNDEIASTLKFLGIKARDPQGAPLS